MTFLSTSANGKAPVTSASPPVLTSGKISDATARTCMRRLQVELVDHGLRDQADALLGEAEALGVEYRILADDQPLRNVHAVIDDDALQARLAGDDAVGQHHHL